MQNGAGAGACYEDGEYEKAGCKLIEGEDLSRCRVITTVNPPSDSILSTLKEGTLVVTTAPGLEWEERQEKLLERGVSVINLAKIPRISRAQSMDALSSQANLAGYRAALEAAVNYRRLFPLMMTSAGSARPARVAVLGAGVAGLQALATAKRLGADVYGYDIRPEALEDIRSLGARVIELGEVEAQKGVYARELNKEETAQQHSALEETLKDFDVIITAAGLPGKKPPLLVTEKLVRSLKTGSVIVDLLAASGGNCELTEKGKTVIRHGVTIVGTSNYAAMVAGDASRFYSKNVYNVVSLLCVKEGDRIISLDLDKEDEIIKAVLRKGREQHKLAV
ncbi:MAG: NAD(P)(+) transhydrogenase (Re/Si-specific) subunit alpha [Candidatus Dadabacteria bacterium]|nr:MAG: NAD(P)(+) transhydrogenase (Re/Si-specific) subunit alpha [Candidatus Dadabacteria bacterium]